jgi:phosphate transport system permease protein
MAAAAPAPNVSALRLRVREASARIGRIKRLDRLATGLITAGGLLIIVAVSFIFVFILGEALPLFRGATGSYSGTLSLASASAADGAVPAKPLAFGIDEYQLYLYELLADGRVAFFRTKDGSLAREIPLARMAGARLTAASRTLLHDYLAAGTSDGRVVLQQVRFSPRYEAQKLVDLDLEVVPRGELSIDSRKRAIHQVAYEERDETRNVAAVIEDSDEIVVVRFSDGLEPERHVLKTEGGDKVTLVRFGRSDTLIAATERGNLYHWELSPEPRLTESTNVSSQPITALEYTLGEVSFIVGDARGSLSAWFRVRQRDDDPDPLFVKAHSFESLAAGVRAIGPSPRDKSFLTVDGQGAIVLHHMTSERKLLELSAPGPRIESALLTPKMDAILAKRDDGGLARFEIHSPHPEVSWHALFGKLWYEGYPKPEYTWQSTGGTDDFEPKLSLVPLVFGTLKGTLYALLFAIPLAILGALYTSQFMHPSLKAKIKPSVEIMAALPSVVVGFIAGLWLAARVEREIVPVLLMVALLPLFGTLGILFWDRLPQGLARRLKPGMEVALILPLLVLGAWTALQVGPWFEAAAFQGDFRAWLQSAAGLVYDQRNCLVVGLAMGFAVIPIIFTISEDAFSSVPQHLTAASLALGSSRWQTATRIVLPTASPGVFSAVMVGFGRAIGETMIVLMATGNTPVLDWSIFNGMRTLSANIAVEIPEAPYHGTLYRTLFLAALALFAMTFAVNTVAELIRQRLRDRYRAI